MGIYIKDLEMPDKCQLCKFAIPETDPRYEYVACVAKNKTFDYQSGLSRRQEWCPLIEVPTPHGRLIDADRLDKHILYAPISGVIAGDGPFWTNIVYEKHINSTPTIIEAEGVR